MARSVKDLVKEFEEWVHKTPVLAVPVILGTLVVGTGEVLSHWSEILDFFHPKKEVALELTFQTAKGDFSRRFAELAWRRLFWTRNYLEKIRRDRALAEQDYAWNKHLDSVADWSADSIVNMNGFEEYYPNTNKSGEFDQINDDFRKLELSLVDVRTTAPGDHQKALADCLAKQDGEIDKLNTKLYFFALNRGPNDKPH
jgi:hypothetical protein